ncbi:hypothetical protein [Fulvivirga sp.]|uniref:hypothetical protein n=1 Tax=Fulvivirga sp. TaxID=1931237 RepID=UPI0032EC2F60
MNLEAPVEHLEQLMNLLCKKLNVSLDKAGFMTMAEVIQDVDVRYVRDKLHGRMTRAKVDRIEKIKLSDAKLNTISEFLGFKNFIHFQNSLSLDVNLLRLVGSYYSFVRKNDIKKEVLRSPVKIERRTNEVILKLKGKDRNFEGKLQLLEGCIFCLMKSDDKVFHHVYKLGNAQNPIVLQGVFSGISSANSPIGGRCLLIKQDIDFDQLVNKKLDVNSLLTSLSLEKQNIGKYFEAYENNNLSIRVPSGFDLDDLA